MRRVLPDGLPVVLLHGVGTTGWMWTKQLSTLAGELRLLVSDLRGHGRSSTLPWVSIPQTARLVAEMINARTTDGRA